MSRCMNSNNPQMTKGLFCQIPFSFSKNNPLSWDPQIKICRTKSHLDITLWYVFSSQHRLCFLGISFAKSSLNCHCRWQLNFFWGGTKTDFQVTPGYAYYLAQQLLRCLTSIPTGAVFDFGRVENYRN